MISFYQRRGKRIFDLLVTVPVSIVVAPVAALVFVVVRLRLGHPAVFVQHRPGLNSRPFRIFKFRTMSDTRDDSGNLLPDADRLTPLGRWLRSTSLDEIPTLWNVLAGEMSLVGPRPLLMGYLARYDARQAHRHDVRPGVTGLAQVTVRNAAPWQQKLECDVQYVERCSFFLDLRILLRTIVTVLRREGINQPGHATMEEFKG
jgi:lipopolysaccharide/colanic/teichoic acid biosynthesis glycosyltransferase